MSTEHTRLREAVDKKNINKIKAFTVENPNFNYNQISPNGASALWWALMPPKGHKISLDVVKFLLGYLKNDGSPLVNPTQRFAGLTPRQYLVLMNRADFKAALKEVKTAENNYQVPVNPLINPNNLASFANDAQSAHNSLVTSLSRNNRIRLYQYYVNEKALVIDDSLLEKTYNELKELIQQRANTQQDSAQQMLNGLDFCFKNTSKFAFTPPEESDTAGFNLTFAIDLA